MRYASKRDLLDAIEHEHATFVKLSSQIPHERWRERGVWGDGWTLLDLHTHLTAWEKMCLRWYRDGRRGKPQLPAPGYTWLETPDLNKAIRRKHARKPVSEVLTAFDASYREILGLARSLTRVDLFEPGRFAWTGKNPFITYLGANTASHYRTASTYLKRWLRSIG